MMYQKVELKAGKVFAEETKEYIGREIDSLDGIIVVEKDDGKTVFAEYGTMVGEDFYFFCRNTIMCAHCHSQHMPTCRYNSNTNKKGGYYLCIEQ
jgi:hypothetical protein